MGPKKLYRSETNKMLCGVCGGLADYLNLDATIVRLLFVLFGCTGTGIVAYVVAAIIMPTESNIV
ncbi:phage shock protein C (PspC) family protein [Mobilisporobacter senegalensis]|uniref:Phage shock protein C (PspC) family protein n=1 Tax=Mobilisporobacter senegalensis TaxID=1329262 RepID=A0A3N1XLZ4_9FIRM|nr:PspC domain-containing protein [Mobilisporobacter senegalensis]ROR27188.1 phage shock protein C (PspC) family protein [Mobilisporobacter senegalensis]